MTTEEAKDYVMTHLPCTMKGVVTLFDMYFKGAVKLDSLVGIAPQFIGYSKLVFYLKFAPGVLAQAHPMSRFKDLMQCFRAWAVYHDFKIEREGFEPHRFDHYVVWIKPPIEIKEDR